MSISANNKPRMVLLEINNSGSWKIIIRFDCSDDGESNGIMAAAGRIASSHIGKPVALRIRTDESVPCVLSYWNHTTGWKSPVTAAEAA